MKKAEKFHMRVGGKSKMGSCDQLVDLNIIYSSPDSGCCPG
jgi:hypothetical protein